MSKTRYTRLVTPTRREVNCNTTLRYVFHFTDNLFFNCFEVDCVE